MTTGASLNDIKNVLGQIKSYGFDSGSWGLNGKEKDYINSVWTAGEGIEEITSDDDEEKAKGFQKLLKELISLAQKFGNNEANTARKEVSKQEKQSQKIASEVEETNKEIQSKINEIGNGIAKEAGIIEAAQGEIDNAGKSLEEKQKELQETLEKITKLKDELGQITDPEEQKEYLAQIKELSGVLPAIIAEITNIQQILTDNINEVSSSVKTMTELEGNAETAASKGAKEIKSEVSETKELTAEGTETTTKGATNKGVEIAAQAAETTTTVASAVPVVGAFAQTENQELMQLEMDHGQAADERIPGGAETLHSAAQALGKVNSSINYLAEFKNAIGTGLQNYANLAGAFGTTVEPMITSLGSFNDGKDILANKEEIDSAVDEDLSTIKDTSNSEGADNNTPAMLKKPEKTSNDGVMSPAWTTQQNNFFGQNDTKEQKNDLKTPRVNVIQFGI